MASQQTSSWVNTVRGPVPLDKLGTTLMHEHVLVDFIGADKVSRERYNVEEVFKVALAFPEESLCLGLPQPGGVHSGLPWS